jgi:hypothetical protein
MAIPVVIHGTTGTLVDGRVGWIPALVGLIRQRVKPSIRADVGPNQRHESGSFVRVHWLRGRLNEKENKRKRWQREWRVTRFFFDRKATTTPQPFIDGKMISAFAQLK